jgi:hypothetical protein
MSKAWEPITVGQAVVEGFYKRTQRLIVRFPLSANPPREWSDYVTRGMLTFGEPETPKPELKGDAIVVISMEGKESLEACVGWVSRQVEQGNKYYAESVIPDRQARLKSQQDSVDEQQRRLDEARSQLAEVYGEQHSD